MSVRPDPATRLREIVEQLIEIHGEDKWSGWRYREVVAQARALLRALDLDQPPAEPTDDQVPMFARQTREFEPHPMWLLGETHHPLRWRR